jgi:hypothetical protein
MKDLIERSGDQKWTNKEGDLRLRSAQSIELLSGFVFELI